MHLPLYPLVQAVPVSLFGPRVLSLLEALEGQVSHKAQCPPVKHGNIRRQGIRYSYWLQAFQCWYTVGCFIPSDLRLQTVGLMLYKTNSDKWFLKLFVVWAISDVKTQEWRCCDHWPGLLSVQVGLQFLSGQEDPDESKVKTIVSVLQPTILNL